MIFCSTLSFILSTVLPLPYVPSILHIAAFVNRSYPQSYPQFRDSKLWITFLKVSLDKSESCVVQYFGPRRWCAARQYIIFHSICQEKNEKFFLGYFHFKISLYHNCRDMSSFCCKKL